MLDYFGGMVFSGGAVTYREANVKGVLYILNKVRDDLTEQYLRTKLAEKGVEPLGIIHETLALSMAWLMGESLIQTPAQAEAEHIVKALEIAEKTSAVQPVA